MLQLRHPARLLIKHIIRDGNGISFWWDNWALGGPLCTRFSSAILLDLGLSLDIKVQYFIVNHNWCFPHSLLSSIPKLSSLIPPCPSRSDTKRWIASSSGLYSLMHTTSSLAGPSPLVHWFNLVWKSPTIPRMKFNLWLTAQARLPTLDS
ncbi:uncharacterized protein LOC132270170 [Cornus florida]|uniref:uncharacterized protein LOC132270170 n=1 Tax=Cornus florida TaxID=4283 RepID=UPI00289648B3|nr:uncharacterized protein LOC132270170 [Cornus florida]